MEKEPKKNLKKKTTSKKAISKAKPVKVKSVKSVKSSGASGLKTELSHLDQDHPNHQEHHEQHHHSTMKRIGGYLHQVTHVKDPKGKIFNFFIKPIMVELRPRDIMQIVVGAALFAIPVSFTEEVWKLGETLPNENIIGLTLVTLVFIAAFVYFNFYRYNFKDHKFEYLKRVLATYFLSLFVVAGILTLIGKCPWGIDNLLAIKRIVIVSFPAAMSATLSDTLK